MAQFASKEEESEPLAWKLNSRLGVAEETESPVEETESAVEVADDAPMEESAEEPAEITSVIEESSPILALEPVTGDLTLFESATPPHQGMVTFTGSVIVHALAGALLWFGLAYKPPNTRVMTEHYRLRQIDLETLAELEHARIPYPKHQNDAVQPLKTHPTPPPPSHAPTTPVQSLHPLIQPDLPNPIKLAQEVPVPRLVLWQSSKTVVQKIVPPALKRLAVPNAIPVLDQPNQEMRVADVAISSNNQLALKSQVIPSTTVPVTARDAIQTQQPLSSVSQIAAAPAPAAILSLSDIQLQKGTAELPPVNSAPKSDSRAGLAPGQGKNASTISSNGTSGSGADAFPGFTVTPLSLSREGHFSAVIVGADLEDDYPELAGLWAGRATYTAYLNVGLSKSWILQYALPRGTDATTDGKLARVDAPWPYTIVRPNLAPGAIDADALMIHGFINASGRFENLSVAFPQPFSIGPFVLNALQKWQFRPATRGGQATRVEVLLIIPEIEQ